MKAFNCKVPREVECPLCQHKNLIAFLFFVYNDSDTAYPDRNQVITCNVHNGGCDKEFVASLIISATTRKIAD